MVRHTSHSSGMRYLAMSPDGETMVTGGWDETLRLWQHVFSRAHSCKVSAEFVHVERYILLLDHTLILRELYKKCL
jgi:hypothetical protein